MAGSNPPLLIVEELLTDDCLVVSDSLGVRLIQIGEFLFVDDEIISGSLKAQIIEQELDPIVLKTDDSVYFKLFGEYIPKGEF